MDRSTHKHRHPTKGPADVSHTIFFTMNASAATVQRAQREGWLLPTRNYIPHKLAGEYRFAVERIDRENLEIARPHIVPLIDGYKATHS